MRITINLLGAIVARREKTPKAPLPGLPVYGIKGLQPGVNLDDSAAMLDLMASGRDSAVQL